MKMGLTARCALVAGLAMTLTMVATPVLAHHGSRASYDLNKPVTMKAAVTSISWQNPHVFLSYDVKDDSGNVTNWGAEMAETPHQLGLRGWAKDTLKPGDEITATVSPSKAGTARGLLSKVVFHDKVIYEANMRAPE
jgi:hypothetical protein